MAPQMSGADGGESCAGRAVHVDYAPAGQVALKGARCFLFDLRPGGIGNRGELAMQIIHGGLSPLREPIPSEPSFWLAGRR